MTNLNNPSNDIKLINGDASSIEYNTKPRFISRWIKSLYFDPHELAFDSFFHVIMTKLKTGITYSILFKVQYNGVYFGMLGYQEGLILSSIRDSKAVDKLYKNLVKSLKEFSDEYSAESIDIIQMTYVIIKHIPNLKLKNINNIKLNKGFIKVSEGRYDFSSKLLPLTTNTSYFGTLLVGDARTPYLDIINKEKLTLFHKEVRIEDVDSMFLYNNQYIIINNHKHDLIVKRDVFYADTGKYKGTFVDTTLDKSSFTRSKGNLVIKITNHEVGSLSAYKMLPVIRYEPAAFKDSPNPYIGSIDLETFKDTDGRYKIYALGFVVLNEKPQTFFLDDTFDSYSLLLKCFDIILTSKYDGYIFYTHNFGQYDSVFILKILKEVNNRKGFDYYNLDPLYRDDKLIRLSISIRKELANRKQHTTGARKRPGFIKITIVDSYTLLNNNLFDLSRSFGLVVTKGYFPHSFVSRDTLNYSGNTPHIDYWKGRLDEKHKELYEKNDWGDITDEEYKGLYSKNWNLKNECLKYLDKDLISLLNIMDKFNNYIFRNYDLQMTESSTISRLALNIFLKNYLKDSILPVITSNMYKDIKQAYFGGVTEVYKPYGKSLYYYDVNSLYPFSSLNCMPGRNCRYMESFYKNGLPLNELFGFFYCEVETNDNYIGLLPVRTKEGIIMPNGKWFGWYFSEELKLAADNGYIIRVIKGYNFDKEENIFNRYVEDLYKIKSHSEGHIKVIAKSLLNNLLGRFGMDINKSKTDIVNREKLVELQSTRVFESYPKHITENDFLISYYPDISREVCESHGKDFINVYTSSNKADFEKGREFTDVSLTTAAAVTSYARIYMSKIKLDALNKGIKIYYTDTDSLVMNAPLNHDLVGKGLGQFKLEHDIKEAYFMTSKTYCIVPKQGKNEIKVKGGFAKSLNLNDFKLMYKGRNVKLLKRDSIVNEAEGYVGIADKAITLYSDSYKKRDKIYKNSKWTDTKPLTHNPQ